MAMIAQPLKMGVSCWGIKGALSTQWRQPLQARLKKIASAGCCAAGASEIRGRLRRLQRRRRPETSANRVEWGQRQPKPEVPEVEVRVVPIAGAAARIAAVRINP